MARSTSLVLLLIMLSVALGQSTRKCCAPKHILSHLIECVPWKQDILLGNDLEIGFPTNCTDFRIVPAYQNEEEVTCIDNMLNIDETIKLVGIVCNESEKFPVPKVDFLNKCCATNRKYTDYKSGCWDKDVLNDNRTLTKFINAVLNTSNVVNVHIGVPRCKSGYVLVDYKLHYRHVWRQASESVLLKIPGKPDILMVPEDSCLDLTTDEDYTMVVRACRREELICGKGMPCIRKCCPDGESYVAPKTCQNIKRKFEPQFYKNNTKLFAPATGVIPAIAHGLECSNDKFVLNPYVDPNDIFYILNKGDLFVPVYKERFVHYSKYCIEDVHFESSYMDGMFAFVCFPERKTKVDGYNLIDTVKPVAMIISSLFLLITFFVYCCLPSLQNLHGKTIMCYVASLLGAYVCLTAVELGSSVIPPKVCITLGYAMQFLFLSAFSWLNVICFNIWWSIRSVRSNFLKKQGTTYRFLLYSVYSWGLPFTITTITALADIYEFLPPSITPRMGQKFCFFHNDSHSKTIFFDTPISIQFVLNTIMFILTIRVCSKVKSELQRMQNNASAKLRYQADKTKLILNIKLFIVMGLSWVCEAISWYFHDEWIIRLMYLSDAANVLQGVFIFFILVVKKKVLRAIKERLHDILPCCFNKIAKHRPSTTSTIFTTTGSESRLSSSQIRK